MNEGLIPRRYAKALYKLAGEKGKAKQIYGLMNNLGSSFASTPALQATVSNPFVSDADKEALLTTGAAATADDTLFADFLKLLAENRRIDMAGAIARAYSDLYRRENRIHAVTVTSAAPMAPEDEKRLKELILRHLDGGTMEYRSLVNPDLLGGFTVNIGNEKLDASIANELKQLRLNLLSK